MLKYHKSNSVTFTKTNESFGGFSNMCSEFPITNGVVEFPTSEHLYQICKFGEHPQIQRELLNEKNPMVIKNKTKKYKGFVRKDWENIKGDVMKWGLKGKFVSNFIKFGNLLTETGGKLIVEVSKRDGFWGTKEVNGFFEGENTLGIELMRLRSMIWTHSPSLKEWEVEGTLKLKIFGEWMERVSVDPKIYELGLRSFTFLMKKHKTGLFTPVQENGDSPEPGSLEESEATELTEIRLAA
jgi:ribA/ribD-fused uncharacterized protein